MVAIVGASGSGKSTLMNILGCLDRPTSGDYRVSGRSTGELDPDELAELRREHFGFIFQRYHLLADLSATGNVEVPAVMPASGATPPARRRIARAPGPGRPYRSPPRPAVGRPAAARQHRAGADERRRDHPGRRADRRAGHAHRPEVLRILEELNAAGHTIILVTHDMNVARHAQRIIEISDGEIVSDRRNPDAQRREAEREAPAAMPRRPGWQAYLDRCGEALRMALLAMNAHRLRTSLTMLGIIIGIAAVVSVVALGEGSRRKIMDDIAEIGTNTVEVFPGKDFGDEKAAQIHTLRRRTPTLARESYVDSVTPEVGTTSTVRYRNVSVNGSIQGVGEQFFRVRAFKLAQGKFFDETAVARRAQEVVIDDSTRRKLFGSHTDPIGQVIFLGSMPARVIGVTQKKDTVFGSNETLNVWIPYTTALSRVLGQRHLRSITVRVRTTCRRSPPRGHRAGADAPARDRFLRVQHGRRAQDHRAHHGDHDAAGVHDRADFADGRRHRRHEHHAGVRYRAHPRDRRAHGGRRGAATSCSSS